jgi:hypothetical protein
MARVPISCAKCGWSLGMGNPVAVVQCAHCGCWMAARAAAGDLDSVAAGIAVVAVVAAAAIGIGALISVLAGNRSR